MRSMHPMSLYLPPGKVSLLNSESKDCSRRRRSFTIVISTTVFIITLLSAKTLISARELLRAFSIKVI